MGKGKHRESLELADSGIAIQVGEQEEKHPESQRQGKDGLSGGVDYTKGMGNAKSQESNVEQDLESFLKKPAYNALEHAGPISTMFGLFMNRLLSLGYKRPLKMEDFDPLPQDDKAENLYPIIKDFLSQ